MRQPSVRYPVPVQGIQNGWPLWYWIAYSIPSLRRSMIGLPSNVIRT